MNLSNEQEKRAKDFLTDKLLEQINKKAEQPFVTAKFGDNWKEYQKKMLSDGQIDIDSIIDLAWKQGRRALLMEDAIRALMG